MDREASQLPLGQDRDSSLVGEYIDECDPAILSLISAAIKVYKERGRYVGD